jgi:hypothetical protein
MHAVALDASGRPRPETGSTHIIQRVVEYAGGQWIERSDSRLLPGETATLFVPWKESDRIRMWLEVHPDDYYDHRVYDQLLRQLPAEGEAARLISRADSDARSSRYRLFETELARPD